MSQEAGGSVARRRWRLLARALTRSSEPDEEAPSRRLASFALVRTAPTRTRPSSRWYDYATVVDGDVVSVEMRSVERSFTADQLIGFNNTGNVRVWPSEECLAYYLMKNRRICRNRRVLELGGGMSCLAGVLVAKYANAKSVTLTDGNATSVDNVRRIVDRNDMTALVRCAVVRWAYADDAIPKIDDAVQSHVRGSAEDRSNTTLRNNGESYDVIICADCLFFDEARLDLVETIYRWLADDGVALIMAPRRGETFRKFAEAAIERGFIARQTERYDPVIWSRHMELLDVNVEYKPDIHYPVLLELAKQKKTPPG